MTKYLKDYIEYIEKRLSQCGCSSQINEILREHKDKIAFMQHERIVHFLVTMMFALILVMFIIGFLVTEQIMLSLLIVMILALLAAYIKHYYFLENTVQEMYRIYDRILRKKEELEKEQEGAFYG